MGVSVFTLTALSGERYCAIVNPLRKLHVSISLKSRTQPLRLKRKFMVPISPADQTTDGIHRRHDLDVSNNMRPSRDHPIRRTIAHGEQQQIDTGLQSFRAGERPLHSSIPEVSTRFMLYL